MDAMFIAGMLALGLGVGVVVGLMGVGGGIVLVPALVLMAGMSQHLAQGTSLLLQLPPIGLGALLIYHRKGNVDLRAGIVCAAGFLAGGYFGSYVAVQKVSSQNLRGLFGVFLMIAALLLFRQTAAKTEPSGGEQIVPPARTHWLPLFLVASGVGVAGGMFGVGGGILLVPLLVLLFHFEQHRAQGTSLVALVPPTGLLAFLNYADAGQVNLAAGLLLMPGVFLGGMAGSHWAQKLSPRGMRRVFAALLFVLGVWQVGSAWIW